MTEILAIVEAPDGRVIALHTATGDVPLAQEDICPRAEFEGKAAELVTKAGGDAGPFARVKAAEPAEEVKA